MYYLNYLEDMMTFTNIIIYIFYFYCLLYMKVQNEELYEKAKSIIYQRYEKPSAYRSGAVIKLYKQMGGTFGKDNKPKPLKRWYSEIWKDVNPKPTKNSYPVYRPTKRINKQTPLTIDEIDKDNLIEQSILKQKIKGTKNLPPFKKKSNIYEYSNPKKVQQNSNLWNYGKVYISDKPSKKYYIINPNNNKRVYFGSLNPPYEDFTKHKNESRRLNYLRRTANIKGNWKNDPYSANNISRRLLWNGDIELIDGGSLLKTIYRRLYDFLSPPTSYEDFITRMRERRIDDATAEYILEQSKNDTYIKNLENQLKKARNSIERKNELSRQLLNRKIELANEYGLFEYPHELYEEAKREVPQERLSQGSYDMLDEIGGGNLVRRIQKITNVLIHGRNDYPPKVRDFLKHHGNEYISSMIIFRKPIKGIETFFNIISLGQFEKDLSKTPYDRLFHLGLFINNKYILEKNEVINLSNSSLPHNSEKLNIPTIPNITINELLENTKQVMGDKFYKYNAFHNNCQHFILSVLHSNGINNTTYDEFVKQDLSYIIKNQPAFRKKFINTLTNLGEKVNILTQGGQIKYKKK